VLKDFFHFNLGEIDVKVDQSTNKVSKYEKYKLKTVFHKEK